MAVFALHVPYIFGYPQKKFNLTESELALAVSRLDPNAEIQIVRSETEFVGLARDWKPPQPS